MSQKGYSLLLSKGIILFEKRDLPLLILIVLLFIIGAIVPIKRVIDEHSPMVEVCRNALSPSPLASGSSRDLKYGYLDFSGSDDATVYFGYRGDTAFCHVHRNGSEWEVNGAGFFGISPYPN